MSNSFRERFSWLNSKQLEAVTQDIEANVRVLAPPGSGKTTGVLVPRYAWLIEQGVPPSSIAAIVFNRSMADELTVKLTRTIPELVGDAQALRQVSTIHAFCKRLLEDYGVSVKMPGRADSWRPRAELEKIIEDVFPEPKDDDVNPSAKEVMGWINTCKAKGLLPDEDETWWEAWDPYYGPLMDEVRSRHDQWMSDQEWFTFADQLLHTEVLLRDEDARLWAQERTPWIMVDEAQDVSAQALRIILRIGRYVTMVGDLDQLLYRFAGADPSILAEKFPAQRPVKTVFLDTNYRSAPEIIHAQGNMIANNYGDKGGPYPQEMLNPISARENAAKAQGLTYNQYEDAEEEAGAAVEAILSALAGGASPDDFFVLARTRAQLGYLEGPLLRNGVPFINLAGGSFWASPHIRQVLNYLRIVLDPRNRDAFSDVYNVASSDNKRPFPKEKVGTYAPTRYLGKRFLQLCPDLESLPYFLEDPDIDDAWRYVTPDWFFEQHGASRADDLLLFTDALKRRLEEAHGNPASGIQYVLDHCYYKYLKATSGAGDDGNTSKLEDYEMLIDVASKYSSLSDFISDVDELVVAAKAAAEGGWEGRVVLSTIHAIKGAERPVVFGLGFCEGNNEEGMPVGLLPHTFSLRQPPSFGVLPGSSQSPVEDERCLAYVLVSRAMEAVHLSSPKRYRTGVMRPSRFVYEMGLYED